MRIRPKRRSAIARLSTIAAALLIGILFRPSCLSAQVAGFATNWHQWRGPEANGVSRTAKPPLEWSESKNIQWKVEIDGEGSSTPIVWNDKVFLLTAINTGKVDASLPKPEDQPKRVFGIKHPNTSFNFTVLCLNRKTGEELWRKMAIEQIPHEGHHGDNNFASESPTTDGKRLYCYFGSAGVFCFDLEGNQLWERDLGKLKMQASLGEGCSPVLHDGKLVIVRDNKDESYLVVLDASNGEEIWRVDRDETGSWATPRILDYDGITQVITSGANMIRSYNLADGKLIWECGGLTENAIPCPVVHEDTVFCMTGYQGYALLALPLGAKGDISDSDQIRWTKDSGTPYVASPLLYDDMLYFNQSNNAILTCLDARSGREIIGRSRLPGIQSMYASPVGANELVYVTARNGTTLVLERTDELKVLATNKLDDNFNSSAALSGNQIFLRGKKSLYCIADRE